MGPCAYRRVRGKPRTYRACDAYPSNEGCGQPLNSVAACLAERLISSLMRAPFFIFLRGIPGVGLIVLRLSVAFALFVDVNGHSPYALISGNVSSIWAVTLMACLAAMLCAGFLTAFVTSVSVILQIAVIIASGIYASALYLPVANAIVLVLLGPGAYSVDARLFGPRILMTTSHGARERKVVRGSERW